MTPAQTKAPQGPDSAEHIKLNASFFRRDPMGFLETITQNFGDIARFDLGSGPIVLINDADLVREVFRSHEADLRKPDFLRASNCGYWGDGLTTLEVPTIWRRRRQTLLPLFRAALRIPRLAVATEIARSMSARWADGGRINLRHELRLLTARIALRTVIDADLEGYSDGLNRSGLVPYLEGYGEDFTSEDGPLRMTRPRAPQQMDSILAIIDTRIRNWTDRGDVLSALAHVHLTMPETLSRQDVIGEIIQMLYAGHLTFPFVLSTFWRDVATHGLERQLAHEAKALGPTRLQCIQTLGNSRTTAILRETMRLSPPAPILYREVSQTFYLSGYDLHEGLGLWVSPGLMHKDPRNFPQPAAFLPDRFAAGRLPAASAKAYMPFGAGPRVCIAAAQSISQMTAIILTMARQVVLQPITDAPEVFEVQRRVQD